MMMGTREEDIAAATAHALSAPEVQDDFDLNAEQEAALDVADR
jgi:hypothetical protein